ncbi:MAG: serine/threonine protein kinase, partial [Verrucomicrobia bacterium]|nr:serine/threonine protein kinase [Verrucomicrobiota bacterium]
MASPVVPTSPADDGNTPPSPPASAAEVAFGHFLVPRRADGTLWELGRGAMGVTYRAFDTSLRTEVALKVIRADQVSEEAARRRFQREARAAAKIRHPNIASVLYLGEQGGEFFYAMEFIAGRSLEVLLKENAAGPLPPLVAVALAAQAAAALNAAHKREVVHRDLKPANLMLLEGDALDHEDERTEAAGNRQLKIIDFGLARSFGANRQDDSLVTQTFAGFIG